MTPDQRRIVILYGLVGADAAVVVVMFLYAPPGHGQTDIVIASLLTLVGTFFGALLGSLLAEVAKSRSGTGGWLIGVGVLLLTTLMGVSAGWLAADVRGRFGQERDELTPHHALAGGAIGAAVGLLVLAPRMLRRTTPASRAP